MPRDAKMLVPHQHREDIHATLKTAFDAPSLYDEAIAFVARSGFAVPKELLARDFTRSHSYSEPLRDIWLEIYRAPDTHFAAYQLAEELIDVEDWFQQWRFRHMTTVARIIGHKPGTGGSSGVGYLKTALERRFFPELWDVRTVM